MKTFSLISVFSILILSLSCTSMSQPEECEDSSLVYENDKLSIRLISSRAESPEYLCTSPDFPDLKVYVKENTFTRSSDDDYEYVAQYVIEDEFCTTMYFSVELKENVPILSYTIVGGETGVIDFNNIPATRTGLGQQVADCISDAYTNHGWASVLLWVETAFIPEAVCVVAGACIGHETAHRLID